LACFAASSATTSLSLGAASVYIARSVIAAFIILILAQKLAFSFLALEAEFAGRVAFIRHAYGVCLYVDSIDVLVCYMESRRA
jgi:hypothetical protein